MLARPTMPPPLTVCLNTNIVTIGSAAIKMYPQQAELLLVLERAWPNQATIDDIASGIWGQAEWPDSYLHRVIHLVSGVRPKLARHWLGIVARRGAYGIVALDEGGRRPKGLHVDTAWPQARLRIVERMIRGGARKTDIATHFGATPGAVYEAVRRHLPHTIRRRKVPAR